MKQSDETPPTANVDHTSCNGHTTDPSNTRKDSDNDDAGMNTSSTSSVNDMSATNCPDTSSNENSSEIATINPIESNELVVQPEISFSVRVQTPGLDAFQLPVGSVDRFVADEILFDSSRSPRVNSSKRSIKY